MGLIFSKTAPENAGDIISEILMPLSSYTSERGVEQIGATSSLESIPALEVWLLRSALDQNVDISNANKVAWKYLVLGGQSQVNEIRLSFLGDRHSVSAAQSDVSTSLLVKLDEVSSHETIVQENFEPRILQVNQLALQVLWFKNEDGADYFALPDYEGLDIRYSGVVEQSAFKELLDAQFEDLRDKLSRAPSMVGGRPFGLVRRDVMSERNLSLVTNSLFLSSTTLLTSGHGKKLPFTMQRQEMDYWCWAAVAASVSELINEMPTEQCSIASICLGKTVCCEQPSRCNEPWLLEYALGVNGNLNYSESGYVSLESIKEQIEDDLPVCARIEFGEGTGHFVVISGYEEDWIFINDPLRTQVKIKYQDFVAQYDESGSWNWTFYCA